MGWIICSLYQAFCWWLFCDWSPTEGLVQARLFGAWGPLLCNHEQTCMNGLLGTVYMYICNPLVDCPQEPIHICLTIMPAHLGMFCVCFCLVWWRKMHQNIKWPRRTATTNYSTYNSTYATRDMIHTTFIVLYNLIRKTDRSVTKLILL